jgi:hypothetical protein
MVPDGMDPSDVPELRCWMQVRAAWRRCVDAVERKLRVGSSSPASELVVTMSMDTLSQSISLLKIQLDSLYDRLREAVDRQQRNESIDLLNVIKQRVLLLGSLHAVTFFAMPFRRRGAAMQMQNEAAVNPRDELDLLLQRYNAEQHELRIPSSVTLSKRMFL